MTRFSGPACVAGPDSGSGSGFLCWRPHPPLALGHGTPGSATPGVAGMEMGLIQGPFHVHEGVVPAQPWNAFSCVPTASRSWPPCAPPACKSPPFVVCSLAVSLFVCAVACVNGVFELCCACCLPESGCVAGCITCFGCLGRGVCGLCS